MLGDARERPGRFGLLKVAFGAIPAIYTNHEVRRRRLF